MTKTVNMEELARLLQPPVSLTTLSQMARARDENGMPIETVGGNGVAYAFDFDAVAAWWQQRNADKAAAKDERLEQLDLWARETYGEAAPRNEQGRVMTADERKKLAEAVRLEDYNRRQRGELVDRRQIETEITNAVIAARIDLTQIPAEAATRLGLNPEQTRLLGEMIERRVNGLATKLGAKSPANDAGDQARAA